MDNSSRPVPEARHPVLLPAQPFSFWLRIAHIAGGHDSAEPRAVRARLLKDFELVFLLEGSAWIWLEAAGGSVDLQAGDLAFLPPGYVHAWAGLPGRHLAVHFDLHARPDVAPLENIQTLPDLVRRTPLASTPLFELGYLGATPGKALEAGCQYQGQTTIPLRTRTSAPKLWRTRLLRLVQHMNRRTHLTVSGQAECAEILGWALNTIQEDAARQGVRRALESDPRILQLLERLDAPRSSRPSVEELAAEAGMGLTAFRAAFIRAAGRPPHAYLEELRMQRAARALVETEQHVHEIARQEGYEDPYHFSRVFKRVMGHAPRYYRRQVQGVPRAGQPPQGGG